MKTTAKRLEEYLGPSTYRALDLLLEAEREVSSWLAERGRKATSPLHAKDLPTVAREVRFALLSARFQAALWALREAEATPPASVDTDGTILLDSDRPLASRPPAVTTVRRYASPARRAKGDPLAETLAVLANVKARIPAEVRARAWDLVVSATAVPRGRQPLTKSAVAEALGATPETFHQQLKRERRRARAAGLSAPRGKPGRPKKSGQ